MNFRCHPTRQRRPKALLALVLTALTAGLSPAAPTSSSDSSSAPSSSAYTNQVSPSTSVTVSESISSSSSSSSGSGFSETTIYYRPTFIRYFFPPTPPALGEKIPYRAAPFFSSLAISISAQLAPYVGEVFYSPLATRFSNEDLTKKQLERLAAYRDTRASLLSALERRLDGLRESAPDVRARELSAFAREQAAQIDAFEQEAEAIRETLIDGQFLQSAVNWSGWDANRSWRLGDNLRYESRVDEFKVIRAAAQYYPYVTAAQRRLLQELALELNEPLADPTTAVALDAPFPYFYFSPETARTRLPVDLPEAVTAKISAYQTEKAALKSELRTAIYQVDRSFFYFTRKEKILALIEQQTPRISALETLAEEIRRDLAPIPNPYRPARASGADDFGKRTVALSQDRTQLLREVEEKQREVRKKFPEARVEGELSSQFSTNGSAYILRLIPSRRSGRSETKRAAAYQEELARFNAQIVAKFEALNARRAALNAEVIQAIRSTSGASATSPTTRIDLADPRMRKFVTEYRQRELAELYSYYDTAVFEPGLSSGQRRLLFAAGLRKLNLPIPSGSAQP